MPTNTIVNTQKIANETLMLLENDLGFISKIRRKYEPEFARAGNKIGDTLNVRLPVQHTVNTGQKLNVENIKEETVAIRVDTQNHIDFQFPSQDLALSIDQFNERYLKTAVATLANHMDMTFLAKVTKQVANHVGTPGTTPSSLLTYLQAKAKLDKGAVPKDKRYCLVDPTAEITLVNALTAIFNPTTQVSKQYLSGSMGRAAGMDFFSDGNLYTHTTGTIASSSTPLTNGTTVDGAVVIVTNGWNSSACTINEGDIISVAGLYAVNPMSKASTGQLKQFVVTQTKTDVAGDLTIPISPAIVLSGPTQNCYYNGTVVASGAAIYFFDQTGNTAITAIDALASPQSLVFHPDFATLVCVDLPIFPQEDMKRASDDQLGLSVRVWTQPNIDTDQCPTRIDVLWGGNIMRPEFACRISG